MGAGRRPLAIACRLVGDRLVEDLPPPGGGPGASSSFRGRPRGSRSWAADRPDRGTRRSPRPSYPGRIRACAARVPSRAGTASPLCSGQSPPRVDPSRPGPEPAPRGAVGRRPGVACARPSRSEGRLAIARVRQSRRSRPRPVADSSRPGRPGQLAGGPRAGPRGRHDRAPRGAVPPGVGVGGVATATSRRAPSVMASPRRRPPNRQGRRHRTAMSAGCADPGSRLGRPEGVQVDPGRAKGRGIGGSGPSRPGRWPRRRRSRPAPPAAYRPVRPRPGEHSASARRAASPPRAASATRRAASATLPNGRVVVRSGWPGRAAASLPSAQLDPRPPLLPLVGQEGGPTAADDHQGQHRGGQAELDRGAALRSSAAVGLRPRQLGRPQPLLHPGQVGRHSARRPPRRRAAGPPARPPGSAGPGRSARRRPRRRPAGRGRRPVSPARRLAHGSRGRCDR